MKLPFPLTFCFFLFFLSFSALGQIKKETYPRISASTRQFLWQMENEKANQQSILPSYVYQKGAGGQILVNTFLQVLPGFDAWKLSLVGVKSGTRSGNI